jgi:hypothetical protein
VVSEIEVSMYDFFILGRQTEATLQRLIEDVPLEQWAIALKGAEPAVRDAVLQTMPRRQAQSFEDMMRRSGPVPMSRVKQARQEIMAQVKALADAGEVECSCLPKRWSSDAQARPPLPLPAAGPGPRAGPARFGPGPGGCAGRADPGFQEGLDKGYEEGLAGRPGPGAGAGGLAQGRQQALDQARAEARARWAALATPVDALMQALRQLRADYHAALRQEVVDLVAKVARQVIRCELALQPCNCWPGRRNPGRPAAHPRRRGRGLPEPGGARAHPRTGPHPRRAGSCGPTRAGSGRNAACRPPAASRRRLPPAPGGLHGTGAGPAGPGR